jgi:hypothetical protein
MEAPRCRARQQCNLETIKLTTSATPIVSFQWGWHFDYNAFCAEESPQGNLYREAMRQDFILR